MTIGSNASFSFTLVIFFSWKFLLRKKKRKKRQIIKKKTNKKKSKNHMKNNKYLDCSFTESINSNQSSFIDNRIKKSIA